MDPLKKSILLKLFKNHIVNVESYKVILNHETMFVLSSSCGVHIKVENGMLDSLNKHRACSFS